MVFKDAHCQQVFGISSAVTTHLTFIFHETIFISMALSYLWKSHQTVSKQNLSPFLAIITPLDLQQSFPALCSLLEGVEEKQ